MFDMFVGKQTLFKATSPLITKTWLGVYSNPKICVAKSNLQNSGSPGLLSFFFLWMATVDQKRKDSEEDLHQGKFV